MRVGITGANGFVGKNLTTYLQLRNDLEPVPLDGDVTDELVVDGFECDAIVHLAGKNRDPDDYKILDTNVLGTYTLAKHCLRNKTRLLVAGSIATKGLYGASKRICRTMVETLHENGLDAVYLQLCNLYGPWAKPYYNSFASTVLYCIANGKEYEHLIRNPGDVIQLMHVRDVCQNIESLLLMDTMDVGYKSPRVVDFCLATEMRISIDDFCKVARGEKPNGRLRGRDRFLIRSTLNWYKRNAGAFT
jgi:UDP-2-acetamido-2,6-beta-L-arabino-hexul-4-ose reductase